MRRLFLLLLLFSCLNAWAGSYYEYAASSEDPSIGLKINFDGEIATVTLCKTHSFMENYNSPGYVNTLAEWNNVKQINLVSENGAEYSAGDWQYIQSLLGKFNSSGKTLSLDCSEMIINDATFKFSSYSGKGLGYIKMPNGLVNLAPMAFLDLYNLSGIGWSPALESIGDFAFMGTDFTSITVPEGVTYIGDGAFSFCPNLETITLPSTLERIGADPLEGDRAVIAIHSHNKTAPECEGEICDNSGWNLSVGDFAFYGQCVLYLSPDDETFESYLKSPIWCKFFLAGTAKICLHTYDTNRPLVEGVQELTVDQTNVAPEFNLDDFTRTFKVNTLYQREMTNAKWYTIMLPFPVDAETVEDVFGTGTQILGYSGIKDYILCFQEVKTSLDPDVPYLIKPGVSKGEYEFDGEDTNYSTPTASITEYIAQQGKPSYNQYTSQFVGTYCNKQIPTYAYYLKNNLFYYMPSENTQKGWKAYGAVVLIDAGGSESVAARPSATYLDVNMEAAEATGIDSPTSIAIGDRQLEGTMYTLSGQQVTNPGKGIYIINGKKILIK